MIVRNDLSSKSVPRGFLAAHVAHAAGESGPAPPNSIAVVLGVADERELLHIAERLTSFGVPHVVIYENSGPFTDQATAIGVRPTVSRTAIRKAVSSLALVR